MDEHKLPERYSVRLLALGHSNEISLISINLHPHYTISFDDPFPMSALRMTEKIMFRTTRIPVTLLSSPFNHAQLIDSSKPAGCKAKPSALLRLRD